MAEQHSVTMAPSSKVKTNIVIVEIMKAFVKIQVDLRKSKEYPACWEYDVNGKTYILTPKEYSELNT